MVLRVKLTPTRFPTNSLYTPMDNTPSHSISSVCHPWGGRLLLLPRALEGGRSERQHLLGVSHEHSECVAGGHRDLGISAANVGMFATPPCTTST